MESKAPVVREEGINFSNRIIRDHVRGCSFVDVGALWGTQNEKISVATLAGAKSAAIIDATPITDGAWARCREHCASLGVSGYAEHSLDLNDPQLTEKVGTFEFVYCSGVLYHLPSMFQALQRLFALTERYLFIGSMVVPKKIKNKFGSIDLSGGGMLFVPGLNERTRSIVAAYFEGQGLKIAHITSTDQPPQPFMWWAGTVPNYGPWWWLYPAETLCSLIETVGFKIIETNQNGSVFCRK